MSHRVGQNDYRLHALVDCQQFSDPDGLADAQGIGSANWALFGVVWPAAQVLAVFLDTVPIVGRTFLELGCGLGLPSLVLQQRGAAITACDYHPLAREFLRNNSALNNLPNVAFCPSNWERESPEIGRFDVLVAADVLYEIGHPGRVAEFCDAHAHPTAEIIIADPGRGRMNGLSRLLALQGYSHSSKRCAFAAEDVAPFRGQIMSYRRVGGRR